MTRLSCHRFRSNEVRLWLSVIAYNLGNLWRRLVLPLRVGNWSLTSLQQRLVKTGGRLIKHARYYWLLLAQGHLTRRLFRAMARRMEALPVPVLVKKDRPGQLGNRLQHALWREAVNIVAEGIADAEDVDLAAKTGFGLRPPVYGIFEHLDAVEVEMCTDMMHYIAQDLYNKPQAPAYRRDMIRQGRRGTRSGRGFYDWSKKDPGRVLERRDRFVVEFLCAHRPGE